MRRGPRGKAIQFIDTSSPTPSSRQSEATRDLAAVRRDTLTIVAGRASLLRPLSPLPRNEMTVTVAGCRT